MRALYRLLDLLFPPKCVLCGRLLEREETDLCGACRREGPVFSGGGMSIPFVTAWMAVYRYEGLARDSLLRFKFGGRQSYAAAYGRLLAARIQGELRAEFDLLTYVPVSPRRRWSRGYDQVRLLAEAVGRELGQKPVRALKKNPPQPGPVLPPGAGAAAGQCAGGVPGRLSRSPGRSADFAVGRHHHHRRHRFGVRQGVADRRRCSGAVRGGGGPWGRAKVT